MNILVIGDIILDTYQYCITEKTAAEADIPVYKTYKTEYILGGAANVAGNFKNLGNNVEIISILGQGIGQGIGQGTDQGIGQGTDQEEDRIQSSINNEIKNLLNNQNIKHTLFNIPDRNTTVKTRIIHNDKIITRYDIESSDYIEQSVQDQIFNYIQQKAKIDAIVFSDYNKGCLPISLCKNIIQYANDNNIYTFADPKIKDYQKYRNCFCFKPNLLEGSTISNNKKYEIAKILQFIKEQLNCEHTVLTCGENGLYINDINNHITHTNKNINVIDVTGAGDMALCILTHIYLIEKDMVLAGKISNFICGKSVETMGNYQVSCADIDEYYDIENPKKIIYDYESDQLLKLKLLKRTNKTVFTNGCFDIIHSAHLKLLKFSKKQGDVLIVGLNGDESIKRLKGPTRPINNISERLELLSTLDFIDHIIVFNTDTPEPILKVICPSLLVKGGDYVIETIVGREYADNVLLFNYIENKSTSLIVDKITSNNIKKNEDELYIF
jgi:D-beta-D-heptose 7-phosphate kinase/D-beta-D-heptose 1-phosphate adenosyltransferase